MSAIYESSKGVANDLVIRSRDLLDGAFPPEKRATLQSKIQDFASANPKLASFILANVVLSGLPLVTFIIFSISVFIFALLTSVIVGVLFTLFVTLAAVGFALLFFLPAIFLTTMAATFIWVWGTGAYIIFQWFNRDDRKEAINKKLQQITGSIADKAAAAKPKAIKEEKHEPVKSEQTARPNGAYEPTSEHHDSTIAANGTTTAVNGDLVLDDDEYDGSMVSPSEA